MRYSDDRLSMAQAYVAASNAHDVEAIAPMLQENCRYLSSGVGEHVGKAAILAMMKQFFAANPDVHWEVSAYGLDEEGQVVFDFTITYSGASGQGVETIGFSEDGDIAFIKVER